MKLPSRYDTFSSRFLAAIVKILKLILMLLAAAVASAPAQSERDEIL
jgi:hypothetical protein